MNTKSTSPSYIEEEVLLVLNIGSFYPPNEPLGSIVKNDEKQKVIKVGQFEVGTTIFVQDCRKCEKRHESIKVLFVCQDREAHCNGAMTAVLESYIIEKQ